MNDMYNVYSLTCVLICLGYCIVLLVNDQWLNDITL